jgi:hypothetical protein
MRQLSDTPPHVEKIVAEGYRRMSSARKWKLIGDAYRFGRHLHAAGMRDRQPGITEEEIQRNWALKTLGAGPWISRASPNMQNQPAEHYDVIRHVVESFEQEGIAYAVGGSLASSLHGYPRYTQDADLTAEPFAGKENAFVAHFDPSEYYADLAMIQDAIRRRASFNLIHLCTSFKVDIFIRKDRPFEQSLWLRRQTSTNFDPSGKAVEVISPEDVILLKLEWYRLGGEQSDRQWNDILGVMRTQADNLNKEYLKTWAVELGVADLLSNAFDAI